MIQYKGITLRCISLHDIGQSNVLFKEGAPRHHDHNICQ